MAAKRSKNQLRRERLKQRKLEGHPVAAPLENGGEEGGKGEQQHEQSNITDEEATLKRKSPSDPQDELTEQEAVEEENETPTEIKDSPLLQEFESIFKKFNTSGEEPPQSSQQLQPCHNETPSSSSEDDDDDDDHHDRNNESPPKQPAQLSKRQYRLRNKVPLSSLKISTHRPHLVEPSDVDAAEPYLLVHLKSQPNVIPVPSHWSSKRDYLSSKRGVERAPFQLPKFIRDTGIAEMRQTSTTDDKTLKQQQRERVQVKLGKLDMDYEKLYRAFFQYQTKPRLFSYGDVYEEGKEMVDELMSEVAGFRAGVVSPELRGALGMDAQDTGVAPAWITIMKDIGKPPSFAELIIPGVDVAYDNLGYRDKDGSRALDVKYWGRVREVAESESEEEEEEEEEEDAMEEEEDVEEEDVENDDDEEVAGEGDDKVEEVNEAEENEEPEPRQPLADLLSDMADDADKQQKQAAEKFLYKVLAEKKSDGSMTSHTYNLKEEEK
ncbi:uncharacterized protein LODBEIA_P19790 [Lodderomyces beijingensis]|uniref:PSP proline-rich domain-containing protein n=1 Tax=Lodderomyces beijingensis TaxID=1775926 RepID=A0ABP0ZNA7_9ASCO